MFLVQEKMLCKLEESNSTASLPDENTILDHVMLDHVILDHVILDHVILDHVIPVYYLITENLNEYLSTYSQYLFSPKYNTISSLCLQMWIKSKSLFLAKTAEL